METSPRFWLAPTVNRWRLLVVAVIVAAGWPASAAGAQGTRMLGHVPVGAMARSLPLGMLSAGEPVRFAFTLPLRNRPALDDLLERLYDPQDPLYGQYLTPSEFAQRFAPTQADYDAVAAFAIGAGLQVVGTHSNRLLLDVEGSAAAVQRALGLNLLRFQDANGRVFRAPNADPLVPSSIAARISGVVGLDTVAVRTTHLREQLPLAFSGLDAPLQTGSGPSGGLAPADLKTAYGLNGVTRTGVGQSLAVFELDGYTASDIATYEQRFGLPSVTLQNVLVDGVSGTPSRTSAPAEVTLDIELEIALAPGASKILVYEGPNSDPGVLDTYSRMATDNIAKQMSTSWGLYELGNSTSFLNSENAIFRQMAAQGQSIYAAAGDSGAYDDGNTLSVDDPASQQFVVGVGGTRLTTNGPGGAWLSETTWNGGSVSAGGGGGGISAIWSIPSYQSQVGVIKAPSFGSTTMRNVPDVAMDADPNSGYAIYYRNAWRIYGGTSCGAPVWAGITAVINEGRVAGGMSTLGFANTALYGIGVSSSYSADFHDLADGSTNLFYPAVSGYDLATGWGTPIGAKLYADLTPPTSVATQITVSAVSGPVLQAVTLGATLTRASGGAAVSGETLTFAIDGTAIGTATTGTTGVASLTYTIPEGVGAGSRTITVQHVATAAYGASSGSGTLTVAKGTVSFSLSTASGLPGQTVNLATLMQSNSTAIVGRTVQFTVDSTVAGSAVSTASGATLAWTIPTSLATGPHNVTAAFAGDAAYNTASSTAAVLTVPSGKANVAFSLYAASGSPGQAVTLKTLVYGGGVPVSGLTVQFSVDGGAVGSAISNASGASLSYTIPASMALSTHNVTVVFTGNSTYNSATRTTAALTVTPARASIAFSLYASSGSVGQTVTLRSLMYSGGLPVSGLTVQFAVDGATVGSGVSDSTGVACTYTIPQSLTTGVHNVTVTFAGNSTYASATRTTAALTVQ